MARELYSSLGETQHKLQSIDVLTHTHRVDEWTTYLKDFLNLLGASETAATELAVIINQYLALPIKSNDTKVTRDLEEELNRLSKKLQKWKFDRTDDINTLNEKLIAFGEKLFPVANSSETVLQYAEGDEIPAKHASRVEQQSNNSQEKKLSNQDNVGKRDSARSRRMVTLPPEQPHLTRKGPRRQQSQLEGREDLAAVKIEIQYIQSNLRKYFQSLDRLYAQEKKKLMKELERSMDRLQGREGCMAIPPALRNTKLTRAALSPEMWEMKANILLEDYAKGPHRMISTVGDAHRSSKRAFTV